MNSQEVEVVKTPSGKLRFRGPLGTTSNTITFRAEDYVVGTVLRVEIEAPASVEEDE